MAPSAQPPAILRDSNQLRVETFRKFGLDQPDDKNISSEALHMIDCLSRSCLTIIGGHYKDAVRLEHARKKVSGDSTLEHLRNSEEELTQLRNKQKRLLAAREMDKATSLVCKLSVDLLNKNSIILQRTAPLVAAPELLIENLNSLKSIPLTSSPKPDIGSGSFSLFDFMCSVKKFDEITKYSLDEAVKKFVYNISNGHQTVSYLEPAVGELLDGVRMGSGTRDSAVSRIIIEALIRVSGMKELHESVQKICSNRENVQNNIGERLAAKCSEIVLQKNSSLLDLIQQRPSIQKVQLDDVREKLTEQLQQVGKAVNDIESIEGRIRELSAEINSQYTSSQLQLSSLSFNMQLWRRNILQLSSNPVLVASAALRPPITFDTIHKFTEFSWDQFDSSENQIALSKLSKMELSIDTTKLYANNDLSLVNVSDVLDELFTFKVLNHAANIC